jgi:hypothetical protein
MLSSESAQKPPFVSPTKRPRTACAELGGCYLDYPGDRSGTAAQKPHHILPPAIFLVLASLPAGRDCLVFHPPGTMITGPLSLPAVRAEASASSALAALIRSNG